MTETKIDRLTLNAGGMSEADARRLAELVGAALGRLPAMPKPVDTAKVSVALEAQGGRSLEMVADAVAAAIGAALRAEAVS